MRRYGFILIVLALAAMPARAQDNGGDTPGGSPDEGTITKVGTTSAQFLKLGVGARAIALGGSFVAEASDLSAHYGFNVDDVLQHGVDAIRAAKQRLGLVPGRKTRGMA